MKQAFLILALGLALTSSAQMNRLFFGCSWNDIPALTDSIKTALPGFSCDSMAMTKSGKSQTLFFKNASGSSLEVNILKAYQNVNKISTVQMVGSKEAVLTLYKHFVNPSFQEASTPVLILAKTPEGQSLPITCFQDSRRGSTWILASKNPY
jgi:hypothetical protein